MAVVSRLTGVSDSTVDGGGAAPNADGDGMQGASVVSVPQAPAGKHKLAFWTLKRQRTWRRTSASLVSVYK